MHLLRTAPKASPRTGGSPHPVLQAAVSCSPWGRWQLGGLRDRHQASGSTSTSLFWHLVPRELRAWASPQQHQARTPPAPHPLRDTVTATSTPCTRILGSGAVPLCQSHPCRCQMHASGCSKLCLCRAQAPVTGLRFVFGFNGMQKRTFCLITLTGFPGCKHLMEMFLESHFHENVWSQKHLHETIVCSFAASKSRCFWWERNRWPEN